MLAEFRYEHRAQCVLVTLHCALILGGTLLVGAMTKVMLDQVTIAPRSSVAVLQFVRYFGLSLLAMPLSWTILTLVAERSDLWWATRRFTIATGALLLAALAIFYFWAVQAVVAIPGMSGIDCC